MRKQASIANFDSAAAMLQSLSRYLHGRDFPMLGMIPRPMMPLARLYGGLVNTLPQRWREQVYIWSGWVEGEWPPMLGHVDFEKVAEWVTNFYPPRKDGMKYPAMMIGSSNGALVHLCCALGIPWLPQSMLMPVKRQRLEQDDPMQEVNWSIEPARRVLDANPDIALHHMHDPNQDRLMVERMAYFRAKRLRLGPAYEQFLHENLEPGGTIFTVECQLKWPTTQLQDRHYFQFGALGGAEIEEFHHGSQRVKEYLRRYESPYREWDPPEPDADRPEAEWGFQPQLRDDIERFAEQHGYNVRRIIFDQPHDVSPLVADFYREWNECRGVMGNRLLAESFILHEPYWTIRTGATPYWMVFNKEPSVEDIEAYLDSREPFDEIYMMLFSHGVESVGLASIERWREVLRRARRKGEFVGVDERKYPRDFGVYARYHDALRRQIRSRYPLPAPLPLDRLYHFLHRNAHLYKVHWKAATPTPPVPMGVGG